MTFSRYVPLIISFICFLFGSLSLILVIGGGDGTWVLYAKSMLNGSRLYSDLSVNQQPLFFLLSVLNQKISQNSILLGKSLFIPILFFFIYFIYKISSIIDCNNFLRAILIFSIFFTSITFEAFRFDDYHALTSLLVLISIYYSILLFENKLNFDKYIIYQSILFSFTFLTRVNEGLAIFFTLLPIIYLRFKFSKYFFFNLLKIFLIFFVSTSLTLHFINEDIYTWMNSSLFRASSAKGGVLLINYPFLIFKYSLISVTSISLSKCLLFFSFIILIFFVFNKFKNYKFFSKYILIFWFIFTILLTQLLRIVYGGFLAQQLLPFSVLLSYISFLLIILNFFFSFQIRFYSPKPFHLLILYPFFLFFWGSLSSGGYFGSFFFGLATFILVCLYILRRSKSNVKTIISNSFCCICSTLICFMGIQCFIVRTHNPYSWHAYHAESFFGGFKGYSRIADDIHGHFFMPTDLYNLVSPVCSKVPSGKTLLSLPFSFANYFCDIKPWQGYIQTFFDTATSDRINKLLEGLSASPPDFIFYQRQIDSMKAHEDIFNGGKPLPHRLLDKIVMDNIENGNWVLIYESDLYPPSKWMLIRTSKLD